jgi:hypothetical protein
MSSCDCVSNFPLPFELSLAVGSAPSFTFTLEDDAVNPYVPVDLSGASLWFSVKEASDDADAEALILVSTVAGGIAILDATGGEGQIDLTEAMTATLSPGKTYFAFLKVQLASGETRVKPGFVKAQAEGVQAP